MSKNERHLMVDIETLDTKPTAAIVAIAALVFDPEDPSYNGPPFECVVSLSSNIQAKRTVSLETLTWWEQQPQAAKDAIADSFLSGNAARKLEPALDSFSDFVSEVNPAAIWANSPSFDLAILRDALQNIDYTVPWQFYQERDVRTLKAMIPDGLLPPASALAHVAIEDCRWQAKVVQLGYRLINSGSFLQP